MWKNMTQRGETSFAGNNRKVGANLWQLTNANFQTDLLCLLISSQYFCTDESSGAHITPKSAGMQVRTQLAATTFVFRWDVPVVLNEQYIQSNTTRY
jgi:hypothetical protein